MKVTLIIFVTESLVSLLSYWDSTAVSHSSNIRVPSWFRSESLKSACEGTSMPAAIRTTAYLACNIVLNLLPAWEQQVPTSHSSTSAQLSPAMWSVSHNWKAICSSSTTACGTGAPGLSICNIWHISPTNSGLCPIFKFMWWVGGNVKS